MKTKKVKNSIIETDNRTGHPLMSSLQKSQHEPTTLR